jgi:hypothetical protein
MPASDQVYGDRDQAQRSGKSGGGQRFECQHRMRRRFDHGSRCDRIGRMNQQRDNGLE